MQKLDTRAYDQLSLKLLRILRAVYETSSTYKAAQQLYVSQSAVARGLDKLRQILNDPLFVRSNNQLIATPYCQRIYLRVPHLLDALLSTISTQAEFLPEQLTEQYSIALNSTFSHQYGSAFSKAILTQAPNATWCFKTWYPGAEVDIQHNRISYGIQYHNNEFPSTIHQEPISQQTMVMLAGEDHPLAKLQRKIRLEELQHWSFIKFSVVGWNDTYSKIKQLMSEQGLPFKQLAETDSVENLISTLQQHPFVSGGCRSLATKENRLVELDIEQSKYSKHYWLNACYPRSASHTALIQWLNALTKSCAKQ
ncbi:MULTISPECIES: LysR family transcriptional regulator [unclassified Agarivorans]|uniref:LysR family transcriptional regulator n=1 Tax=unclassified Agarivorans TaxID=2636026 RepID=UPI0026E318CD|nr:MULTISPECIES: LysR family transcriptional regulator [unclassified Agarivorans]MDO6684970.1 LysR family transcriptional regulator [Agarivorans sp. 3_MG-2023]MDO6714869.1 LysR family transcriptional regulator [Agarivorans sp. 2_MG-2023]